MLNFYIVRIKSRKAMQNFIPFSQLDAEWHILENLFCLLFHYKTRTFVCLCFCLIGFFSSLNHFLMWYYIYCYCLWFHKEGAYLLDNIFMFVVFVLICYNSKKIFFYIIVLFHVIKIVIRPKYMYCFKFSRNFILCYLKILSEISLLETDIFKKMWEYLTSIRSIGCATYCIF